MEFPKILISGDYNVFQKGFNAAGVYMASGLSESSTFKQPIYIGSSNNLKYRIQHVHIPKLNSSKHENKPLQYSWIKNNGNFVWWLMEICEKINTFTTEQHYLDLYRPFVDELGGFNILHVASLPPSNKGKKMPPRSKEYMARQFRILDPRGNIIEDTNVSLLCRKYGLNTAHMFDVLNGKRKEHKGWKLPETQDTELKEKIFVVVSPNGEIIKGKNIRQFCIDKNLNNSGLQMVISGKRKHHKGWTLYKESS